MELRTKVALDDRGKRSISLRDTLEKAVKNEKPKIGSSKKTPSSLETPSFLMNYPLTVDNKVINNALMKKDQGPYNYKSAFKQWEDLYRMIVTEGSVVYVLPSEYPPLQDLPFVANLGCYLPHLKPDTIIISNFKSQPRKGEDDVGIKFFKMNNYAIHQPSTHWEGEADLKWIKGNLYIGGYGIRTDEKSYSWMADKFNMNIITVKMEDPKLYHFDCQFFPITSDKALASTSAFKPQDLKKIEKYMEITEVPKEFKYDGWTNSLKLGNKILCGDIPNEKSIKAHDAIIEKMGYETVGINLDEFAKSGGDLSCLIMHLSYRGR
jgi:N-dimethylarginine dimethylaminohydrolase